MKHLLFILLYVSLTMNAAAAADKPNIVIILADDKYNIPPCDLG